MARYFYDYSVGMSIVRDAAGIVCRDDKAAVRNGWIRLATLLAQHDGLLPWQHFELVVRREDAFHVGRIGMTVAVETPNPVAAAAFGFRDGEARKASD